MRRDWILSYAVLIYLPSSVYISCIHLVPAETNKGTGHQDPKQRLTKQRPAGLPRVNVYIIIGEYTRTM